RRDRRQRLERPSAGDLVCAAIRAHHTFLLAASPRGDTSVLTYQAGPSHSSAIMSLCQARVNPIEPIGRSRETLVIVSARPCDDAQSPQAALTGPARAAA